MKPYDPNAKCAKCRHNEITTVWQPARSSASGLTWAPLTLDEYLHRQCERCGHAWAEAPLDAPQETPVTLNPVENQPENTKHWEITLLAPVKQWSSTDVIPAAKKLGKKPKSAKRTKKAKK